MSNSRPGHLASMAKKEASKARKRQMNESLTPHKSKPNSGKSRLPADRKECEHWSTHGKCKYGDECRYAHPPLVVTSAGKTDCHPHFTALAAEEEKEDEEQKENDPLKPIPNPPKRKDKQKKAKSESQAKEEPTKLKPLDDKQWRALIDRGKFLIAHDHLASRRFRFQIFPGQEFEAMCRANFIRRHAFPLRTQQNLWKGVEANIEVLRMAYEDYSDEGHWPWSEDNDNVRFAGEIIEGVYETLVNRAADKIIDFFRRFAKPVKIQLHQTQVNPDFGCCSPIHGGINWMVKRFRELFRAPLPRQHITYDPVIGVTSDMVYGTPVDTAYRHRHGEQVSLQVQSGYTAIVTVTTRKKYITYALRELAPLTLSEHTRRMGLQGALAHYGLEHVAMDHMATVREIQYIKNAVNWACQFLETKMEEDNHRTSAVTKKALPIVDFPLRAN